jgi:hypothetical protein
LRLKQAVAINLQAAPAPKILLSIGGLIPAESLSGDRAAARAARRTAEFHWTSKRSYDSIHKEKNAGSPSGAFPGRLA